MTMKEVLIQLWYTLSDNFYVDDLLKSVPTLESAIAPMENLINICAKGGFNLTKSVSNNHKVWVSIPIEHWGYGDT